MGFFQDLKEELKIAAQGIKVAAEETAQTLVVAAVVKVDEIERDTREVRAEIKGAAQEAFEKGARKLDEVGKKVAELLADDVAPVAAQKPKAARKPKAKAKKTQGPAKKNI